MKHIGRQVFRLGTVLHTLYDVRVYALEVDLIEIGKAGGVPLRSFHQRPLVRFFLQSLQRILRGLAVHQIKPSAGGKGYGLENAKFREFSATAVQLACIQSPGSYFQGAETLL